MAVANRELIRAINQFNILNTIRNEGMIPRIEIAKMTGLSRASVTSITAELIKENLIFEKEVEDSKVRGRRRILLALNPQAAYVVGVKVSAFHVSFAVTNMQADVLSSWTIPIRTGKQPVERVAERIEEGIRHCVQDAGLQLNQISGIGIGLPGFIDSRSGFCFWTPLYQRGDVPLRDLIQERFNIQTYIENDANTVTLTEQWFGEGRGIDNFFVVTIEHGIGMGIVLNGQLYRGVKGMGAECGHMVIVPDGKLCRCGKKGCIESYVSDFAILKEAKETHTLGKWDGAELDGLTIEEVTALAKDGEPILQAIFENAGRMLGIAIANLLHLLNPRKVIISGEGVRAGELLFQSMRDSIHEHVHDELKENTEILIQQWNDQDWARGAASLVLQELYKSPFNAIKPMI